MSFAMDIDQRQAASIPEAERCKCCGGTGNMLLSWYFQCLACKGDGRSRGPDIEAAADAEFNRRFPPTVPTSVVQSVTSTGEPNGL